jgi:hypothetical protein
MRQVSDDREDRMKISGPVADKPSAALAVIGSCLALSACAGTSAGPQPGTSPSSTAPAAVQKFCQEIGTALHSLDGYGLTVTMNLAAARTDVDKLMAAGISSFRKLETEAPAFLRASIRDIVADFKMFRQQSDKATSVKDLLASAAHGSPAQQPAYRHLLAYAGKIC